MIKTAIGAQRYNNKMNKIFAEAKVNNIKHAPLHLRQMLIRLVEKTERVNSIQHSGGIVTAEDWSELYSITNEARGVLERTSGHITK